MRTRDSALDDKRTARVELDGRGYVGLKLDAKHSRPDASSKDPTNHRQLHGIDIDFERVWLRSAALHNERSSAGPQQQSGSCTRYYRSAAEVEVGVGV